MENNINSGIYIRIDRDNKLLEQLSTEIRNEWLDSLQKEGLYKVIDILCNTINNLQTFIDRNE